MFTGYPIVGAVYLAQTVSFCGMVTEMAFTPSPLITVRLGALSAAAEASSALSVTSFLFSDDSLRASPLS